MKIKKFVLCAAAFASALSIACSLSAATLNVATSATFPPFEFQDSKTGAVQGFEIDLVKAMGEKRLFGNYRANDTYREVAPS
ncbi:transporter substrate-binding domain-containing protein, partial [uncultured Sutterella sp.]|uniref:transporter substrate-binding domain-containing protein n=1 Tax=uncultured Sutterella sp. TaxID=286133 RepID=UPI0025CD347E